VPAPSDTLWPYSAHTRAKHHVLKSYTERRLVIMGQQGGFPELVVVDGFAGPGRYATGEKGSPLILLDALLDHGSRDLIDAKVRFVFIEKERDRYEHLEGELAAYEPLPRGVTVNTYCDRFDAQMERLLGELGPKPPPIFAFIDPFGLSDNHIEVTSRVLGYQGCEVLTYLPLWHIARLIDQKAFQPHLDNLYGDRTWTEARGIQGMQDRIAFLRDLFEQKLHRTCMFTTSFEILDERATNSGYYLSFGTSHPLGFVKMKEAMWKVDPVNGRSYRDRGPVNQELLPIRLEPDVRDLRAALLDRFAGRPCSIAEVERFTDERTRFLAGSHLKKRTLLPMEEDGLVEVVSCPPKRRRGQFPPECVLRFRVVSQGSPAIAV
jgi:three-Cys-motif partner protein